jgi:hypothetical protein
MESYPTVRLSIRITKSTTEPTLHDLRSPTPKQKLKNVSFGSVDIFRFIELLESPIRNYGYGMYSPVPLANKIRRPRRFSI